MREVYVKPVMDNAERLMGLADRNPYSPTYGCFDRNFWHYKVVDFPSARLQEAALTLALLYKKNYPGNNLFKKDSVKELSVAAIKFWSGIQRKNGSFDEWYPNEHSLVSTAFSTYAISEAVNVLGLNLRKYPEVKKSLQMSGRWLDRHDEKEVSNQQAGSICALATLYTVLGDKRFLKSANRKMGRLLKTQSNEGWFTEYGGPDIGYLSLMIDYMSKTHNVTKEGSIMESLRNAVDFLSYFVHPNDTFGGVYGSRNTEYLIPSGLEYMSKYSPAAGAVANSVIRRIKNSGTNLDDRYLCQNIYNHLQAFDNWSKRRKSTELPNKKNFHKEFPAAGICVFSNDRYYAVCNSRKGGTVSMYSKRGGKSSIDSGIYAETSSGLVTSQWIDDDYNVGWSDETSMEITGRMHKAKFILPSTAKMSVFKIFQKTMGRSGHISRGTKNIFRKAVITKSPKVPVHFSRKIKFNKSSITIKDVVKNAAKKISISHVGTGGNVSLLQVPSSKYFSVNDVWNSVGTRKPYRNGSKGLEISREIVV